MRSKLTIKYRNDVTDMVLVFLLLILNIIHTFSSFSIVVFKQANVSWEVRDCRQTSFLL